MGSFTSSSGCFIHWKQQVEHFAAAGWNQFTAGRAKTVAAVAFQPLSCDRLLVRGALLPHSEIALPAKHNKCSSKEQIQNKNIFWMALTFFSWPFLTSCQSGTKCDWAASDGVGGIKQPLQEKRLWLYS